MAGFRIRQSEMYVDVEIHQSGKRGLVLSLSPREARMKAKELLAEADKAEQYKNANRETLDEPSEKGVPDA